MNRETIYGLIVIAGILGACNQVPQYPVSVGENDVAALTDKAVDKLVGNLRSPLDPTVPVVVATVANVDNLRDSSTLGRLITEQVAATLAQDGYDVPEVRLSNTLLVSDGGEFILSREIHKLSHRREDAQAVVTGTYAVALNDVHVILKVIRLSDRKITGTVSYVFPNDPNTKSLLMSMQ